MIKLTAAQLQCDRCKAESEVYLEGQPVGWLRKAEIRHPSGLIWYELCPNCAALPYVKLLEIPGVAAPAV